MSVYKLAVGGLRACLFLTGLQGLQLKADLVLAAYAGNLTI